MGDWAKMMTPRIHAPSKSHRLHSALLLRTTALVGCRTPEIRSMQHARIRSRLTFSTISRNKVFAHAILVCYILLCMGISTVVAGTPPPPLIHPPGVSTEYQSCTEISRKRSIDLQRPCDRTHPRPAHKTSASHLFH